MLIVNFLTQIFDQLNEAGIQIDRNRPTNARLAIILIDNAVELLLYRTITKRFGFYNAFSMGKYSLEYQKNVLRDFRNELKFFHQDIGAITKNEFDMIDVCHKMRNETYHLNILRENIVIDVAKVYFTLCCHLLPRLHSDYQQYPIDTDQQNILEHYQQIDLGNMSRTHLENALNAILINRESNLKSLSHSLSQDILQRIEVLVSNLNRYATWGTNNSFDET